MDTRDHVSFGELDRKRIVNLPGRGQTWLLPGEKKEEER